MIKERSPTIADGKEVRLPREVGGFAGGMAIPAMLSCAATTTAAMKMAKQAANVEAENPKAIVL